MGFYFIYKKKSHKYQVDIYDFFYILFLLLNFIISLSISISKKVYNLCDKYIKINARKIIKTLKCVIENKVVKLKIAYINR